MSAPADDALLARWQAAWPRALEAWSRYTRLRDPRLCSSTLEAAEEGLSGSFAMIRLADQRVVVDLEQVRRLGLGDYAVEVLAHEIGHHLLAPATVTDHVRLLARLRAALPTLERHAPMVANLYTDLLINDRLARQAGLRIADIYRAIAAAAPASPADGVWGLYMGIYEQLWSLPAGALGGNTDDAVLRGNAWLGARLVRAYAGDWLDGAGAFAALLLPWLVDGGQDRRLQALMDTRHAAAGGEPVDAGEIEAGEAAGALHPAFDPRVTGDEARGAAGDDEAGSTTTDATPAAVDAVGTVPQRQPGQAREPFEYGEILRASGIELDDHAMAVRYYREQALPHLVPFPALRQPEAEELHFEGVEPWQVGDPLDELDWMQTLMQSPTPVPGLTTVRRSLGAAPGRQPETLPVDLDLYVDSSGSMPDPRWQVSYLALAGAIVSLSALRSGSRVQATLWSGKQQVLHTDGFVRSEEAILRVLTGFFGGATAFPIHRLRETYASRAPTDRAVHILHLSDDGITTLFDDDERGNSGWDVSARALAAARGGGTMALNLPAPLPAGPDPEAAWHWMTDLLRARQAGWAIHSIRDMEDLLEFARAFARRHYAASSTRVSAKPYA
ncbi:hypothetical protein [Luteimonas sp. A501]